MSRLAIWGVAIQRKIYRRGAHLLGPLAPKRANGGKSQRIGRKKQARAVGLGAYAGRVVVDRAGRFARPRRTQGAALVASLPPAPCLFVSPTGGGGRQTRKNPPPHGRLRRQARAAATIALGH